MIPGSNILEMALTVIGSTDVNYFAFLNRTTNTVGFDVTNYSIPILITSGSVQAVERKVYQNLGLDWAHQYINWFVPELDVTDIARDSSGDVIETLGRRYQLVGREDWLGIDGWKKIIAIDIGIATGSLTNA